MRRRLRTGIVVATALALVLGISIPVASAHRQSANDRGGRLHGRQYTTTTVPAGTKNSPVTTTTPTTDPASTTAPTTTTPIVTVPSEPTSSGPPPAGGNSSLPPGSPLPSDLSDVTTIALTPANFPTKYGDCATVVPATDTAAAQLRFDISAKCDPAGDGHYRTDWSTGALYTAGQSVCTSIPIAFPNGTPVVGPGSWWQFAEAKTPPTAYADWGLYVVNRPGGGSQFDFRMAHVTGSAGNGSSHPSLWSGGDPGSGWNTFVVCSNYATTTDGFIDLYLNGTKVWSASGVYILQGQTTDDLDLNDYTGGSPFNVTVHGAPMVWPTHP